MKEKMLQTEQEYLQTPHMYLWVIVFLDGRRRVAVYQSDESS